MLRIDFPNGYAFTFYSDETLTVVAHVLNLNTLSSPFYVRQKTDLKITTESNNMKPLYQQSIEIARYVGKDGNYAHNSTMETTDCRPVRNSKVYKNNDGKLYSGHWIVPKGEETIKTDVTEMLNLPFSTTVHFINVHLHPYAEYLEFRDKTIDSTLFKSFSNDYKNIEGVNSIDYYSDSIGIFLDKKHTYELICKTVNNTDEEKDMMAVMYLYLHDKEMDSLLRVKKRR